MSYTHLLYHIVIRPRNGTPAIAIEHEESLYRYIWGIIKRKKCVLYRIGGMPDHIHMLVEIAPTISISDFMRDIKTASHKYLQDNIDKFPLFCGWGKSYCAITCSKTVKENVIKYIKGQKLHHRRISFVDEIARIFESNKLSNPDLQYFIGDK